MFETISFVAVNEEELVRSNDPAISRSRLLEAALPHQSDRDQILDLLTIHGAALADRSTLPGHLTGSALVVDAAGERALLMLHAKLGRWLQPGGHADGDHDLARVALREATEETGIEGLSVLLPAIDVDIHRIPERGPEPSHLHLDLRFVVIAPPDAQPRGNSESEALRWVPWQELDEISDEESLTRLAHRGSEAYRRFLVQG
ncbi:MAG: NUDIX hydrolase [Microthrixaceae bacterium]|nr:NUDIX hydrolase [Microthrixaceae bacterium]